MMDFSLAIVLQIAFVGFIIVTRIDRIIRILEDIRDKDEPPQEGK